MVFVFRSLDFDGKRERPTPLGASGRIDDVTRTRHVLDGGDVIGDVIDDVTARTSRAFCVLRRMRGACVRKATTWRHTHTRATIPSYLSASRLRRQDPYPPPLFAVRLPYPTRHVSQIQRDFVVHQERTSGAQL